MHLFGNEQQKKTHSGLNTVELAVFLAVSHFNDGACSISLVLQKLGINPGVHCKNACKKRDHNRLRHSRRKSAEHSKKRRRQIRNFKKGYTETLEALEGPHWSLLRLNFDSNCTAHLLHTFFLNSVFEAYLGMVNVISQRIFGIIKHNFDTMLSMNRDMQ